MTPASDGGRPEQALTAEAAVRATILVSMHDRARRHSLVVELVLRAHRAHLAGATVFEGREGFGESGRAHRTHTLSDDAPVSIVMIDRRERIEQFLGDVAELLEHVLVVLDDVDVVRI